MRTGIDAIENANSHVTAKIIKTADSPDASSPF